jgi:hypothetical protein
LYPTQLIGVIDSAAEHDPATRPVSQPLFSVWASYAARLRFACVSDDEKGARKQKKGPVKPGLSIAAAPDRIGA